MYAGRLLFWSTSAYRYDADYNSRKLLVPAVRVARRAGRRAGRRAAYYYH